MTTIYAGITFKLEELESKLRTKAETIRDVEESLQITAHLISYHQRRTTPEWMSVVVEEQDAIIARANQEIALAQRQASEAPRRIRELIHARDRLSARLNLLRHRRKIEQMIKLTNELNELGEESADE